jgi:pyruvate dehydrogenase E2 component (dihydrolipoamide acetyltransferase)
VNSSYRPASAGQEPAVIRHAHANVGIAVALPDEGLFVPVVRDADLKGLREISKETKGLVERSRTGKPHSSDFGGGTFTISNLGMSDVEEFVAVITPPEAAILAVGSIKQVPVAVPAASGDGQFEVKVSPRMRVTLSGDHRVFAGETGAKFIQEVKRALQSPLDLLS